MELKRRLHSMNFLLVIGIPAILVVSLLFGGLMAKRKGNIGTGKVYGFLLLAILTFLLVVAVSVTQK